MTTDISTINLFEVLIKYKSAPFIFVEAGGNQGDFLIYLGAKKIFDLAGIAYQRVDHVEFISMNIPEDTVVYINGGGDFNNIWMQRGIDDFITALKSPARAVILGPTTFIDDIKFIKERVFSRIKDIPEKKVFIFCRERVSYSFLKEIIPSGFELFLDHDTAFNLRPKDLLKQVPKGKHVLFAIREDKEQFKFERLNLLSLWVDPVTHCKTFEDWVDLHANASRIITNRTHSSIVSSILGKKVVLLPNSYHKNHSIWEYSLKERGVLWQDKIEVSKFASFLMSSKLYKWIGNSHKIRRFYNKFYGIE